MYFGHSSQHILTGKTNNTGDDLAYELEDLTSGSGRLNPVLSSATLASPPAIDKERHYRNTSYSASLNELFRTSGGTDINLNLSYLNDTELRDNISETRWMLPDSSVNLIREGISNVIGTDKVNAELSFKSNGDRLYVNNRNIFSAEFLDIASSVNGMGQNFDRTTLRASTTASLIHRSGEKSAFEINARAAYERTPYSLAIAGDGGQWAGAVQDVTANAFTASLFAGNVTSFRLWNMRVEPTLSASYRLNSLDSRLSTPLGQLEDPSEAANRLMMHRLRVAPAVYAYYTSLHLDISIFIPVAYYMTLLDDRLGGSRTARHKVFAEPSVDMKIKPAASTDISLGYSMNWSMPELSTLFEGAVLSDYRSLTRYTADLTEGMRNHFSFGLSYKDIFNMLFLNFSAGYSLTKPNILYGYDFDGIHGSLKHTVQRERAAFKALEAAKESADNIVDGISNTIVKAEKNTVIQAKVSTDELAKVEQCSAKHIEAEKELLEEHRNKLAKHLHNCEGIWLSNRWFIFMIVVFLFCYIVVFLWAFLKD